MLPREKPGSTQSGPSTEPSVAQSKRKAAAVGLIHCSSCSDPAIRAAGSRATRVLLAATAAACLAIQLGRLAHHTLVISEQVAAAVARRGEGFSPRMQANPGAFRCSGLHLVALVMLLRRSSCTLERSHAASKVQRALPLPRVERAPVCARRPPHARPPPPDAHGPRSVLRHVSPRLPPGKGLQVNIRHEL